MIQIEALNRLRLIVDKIGATFALYSDIVARQVYTFSAGFWERKISLCTRWRESENALRCNQRRNLPIYA